MVSSYFGIVIFSRQRIDELGEQMKSLVKQIIQKLLNRAPQDTGIAKEASSLLSEVMPPLPLPMGISEKDLFNFVTSIRVTDASEW